MSEPDIVFVTRKWAPATGGMETYCVKLTEQLAAIEPVEVIALPGRANGMPPGVLALLAFPLKVFSRYLARAKAPHVLHLGDMAIWPLALPALLWRDTKIVLSAHGTDVAYHRRSGFRGTLYGTYLRLGARILRQARVIANSTATREVTRETGWQDIRVVPLGTDFAPARNASGEHGRALLFAGRMVERKGLGWFVREVLPLLPAGITLKVAGTGWDQAERNALENPRVDYIGNLGQQALAEAFARALCVIVPNIEPVSGEYEGFGLVAVEAASAGGIVLASYHGGLRDAVIDGETGYLVPSGDAAAWAGRIAEISTWRDERRAAFTARAARRACEYYNWHRVARDTLAAYEG